MLNQSSTEKPTRRKINNRNKKENKMRKKREKNQGRKSFKTHFIA